jgi:spore maturation protein CgeB
MQHNFRIAYFAHSVRSDWNNGNAHFLRGLLRSMSACGHDLTIFEPAEGWSMQNLRTEKSGESSLHDFAQHYPDLRIVPYDSIGTDSLQTRRDWRERLREYEIVILHEWNPPELAHLLLDLRDELRFRLLFHDTHHRASSSPEQIRLFGIDRFDGVLAFGEALRDIYRRHFNITRAWTLHEAADTTIFHPLPRNGSTTDVVWIGNWGDNERSAEIRQFLLEPAAELPAYKFTIYGVRYPQEALCALQNASVGYGGYLPNLAGPGTYASSRLTVHIPRQQYTVAMTGIPTIRVFEALACGIPLISAPWKDAEHLFNDGDFRMARNTHEMKAAMQTLLSDSKAAEQQAAQGLATVLARHTCRHRAEQLTSIFEELYR